MVQERIVLATISGAVLSHAVWLALRCVSGRRLPLGPAAKEIHEKLEGTRAQVWLLMMRIGFGANMALVVLLLFLYSLEEKQEYTMAAIECGSVLFFCAAFLLLDSYWRGGTILPREELWAGAGRRFWPSAHPVLMMLLTVVGIVNPDLQGSFLRMQRIFFNLASLNPLEVALLNLIGSGSRLSACLADSPKEGHGGSCGDNPKDVIFEEACFFLASALITYVAREMCKSALDLSDRGHAMLKTSSYEESSEMLASSEVQALCSILQATCDAVVYLDAHMHISRPAVALAMLLGFEGSLLEAFFPALVLQVQEDQESLGFLRALEALEGNAGPGLAAVARISMINSDGDLVRVHCAYSSLADKDGNGVAGYVLGIRELVDDRAATRAASMKLRSFSSQKTSRVSKTGSASAQDATSNSGKRSAVAAEKHRLGHNASGATSTAGQSSSCRPRAMSSNSTDNPDTGNASPKQPLGQTQTREPSHSSRATLYGRSREEAFHSLDPVLSSTRSIGHHRSESTSMAAQPRVMRVVSTIGAQNAGMAPPWRPRTLRTVSTGSPMSPSGMPRTRRWSTTGGVTAHASAMSPRAPNMRFGLRTITMDEVLQQTTSALQADMLEGADEPSLNENV